MTVNSDSLARESWPALPIEAWRDTCSTLHLWTQIIGMVRMELSPPINHWWHVPLYVDTRGLTTSPIPLGAGAFSARFDFIDHRLIVETSMGAVQTHPLQPQTVAEFYVNFMRMLDTLGIRVSIPAQPAEVRTPIPFAEDTVHASYDAEYAHRFWSILISVANVLTEFRSRFIGKCSPVHFFWGSFDLAVTRFSGRRAPERPGADPVTREAYSHEECSAGWWPGGETYTGLTVPGPAFYSYAFPEPPGYHEFAVQPAAARYDRNLGEYLLTYDGMRSTESPRAALLDFLQTTYEAGAILGDWDRAALEKTAGR
ncbi:MAG: DUF5996 family protein [Terriglobales bacterium]